MPASSERLVCPTCGTAYPPEERFCPDCNVPLIYEGADREPEPISERRERARKIKPQLAEGELIRVAGARNQAEGEFIQGLLLEEGVPSLLKRSAGFDVPDFLAAGPRDVFVPASGVATARQVLLEADLIPAQSREPVVAPVKLFVGLLVALALGALIVWLIAEAAR